MFSELTVIDYNEHMFEARIKTIQSNLPKHEIDSLLITSSYNISYLTGISAFSIEEREARLLLTQEKTYLFTDARYAEMVKSQAPFVEFILVGSANPFLNALKELVEKVHLSALGFEEEIITYSEVIDLEETIDINFIPTSDIVEETRILKDKSEIDKIRSACKLSDRAFDYVLQYLDEGITEIEIKAKLENFIRHEKGDISFPSIVAFGRNSAIPHHMTGNTILSKGDTVLIDFGAKKDGYCSDMTRTIFFGEPENELKKIYSAVKESQELAIDSLRVHNGKGFELKQLHHVSSSHLKANAFPEIPHALGHGVGLQVHEKPAISPFTDDKVLPGMIITIEPGVYIPDLGGVRIEDMILITEDGLEILTRSPKDLIIV